MSNLVKFGSAGLPAVQNLAASLRKLEQSAPSVMVILKMDKTGHWVFGAEQEEVENGSRWAVNPLSFVHGYIAWGKGEALGEMMAPITDPLPEVGVPPSGADRGWEMQLGFSLKCISGEDAGMEARYSTTSVGGKRAVQQLGLAIAQQVEKSPEKPVPVIVLSKDSYQHKSYGRVFTPVFEVQEWVSMNGEEPAAEDVQKSDVPEAAPARRVRRTA